MIGFVILHFNELNTTLSCINSISNVCKDYRVAIVDNCSPDGSGKVLSRIFEDNPKINVILNDTNLGFAKGNNIGYLYLKKLYNCDYICISNNDILVNQINFERNLESIYLETAFDICGPQIVCKNGEISPIRINKPSLERAKKDLNELSILYFFSFVQLDIPAIYIINFLKYLLKKNVENVKKNDGHLEKYGYLNEVVLHGCFLIFSKKFINKFDGLCPDTFLYHEEELLYLKAKKENAIIIYTRHLNVIHLEDISTNSIFKSKLTKRRFKYYNEIKSLKILIKELSVKYE